MRDLKLSDAEHEALAFRLYNAIQTGVGIDPPSETLDYSFEDAFRVRRKLVDRLIADGGQPKGHKIGFTSETMQKMYGMTGPDFGILLDSMIVTSGVDLPVGHFANSRAEPELAFVLKEPLSGPGVTLEQALSATDKIYASVEVINSRVGAMRAKANDSLADNAGAGWVVLGSIGLDPKDVDLAAIDLSMDVDGNFQRAPAGDVMGHPAAPLAWLANRLPDLKGLGGNLKAGDIVITGAPVRSVEVKAGTKLHAEFGPFGTIDINFI